MHRIYMLTCTVHIMYTYVYLAASSCGVASLMVAYSLVIGGLGDLLLGSVAMNKTNKIIHLQAFPV